MKSKIFLAHLKLEIDSSIFFIIIEKVSEYDQERHNHKLQASPRHREEELHDIYSNKTSKKTIKAKEPALSSSSIWLQN